MFSTKQAQAYCCEPIDRIQGFLEASESKDRYHIHHRLEEMGLSRQDLIDMGLLYNRPACELVFMNGKEHNHRHSTIDLSDNILNSRFQAGHTPEFTEEHRRHISEAKKGVKQTSEHTAHVIAACKELRATKSFRDKLRDSQEKAWTPEKRNTQSSIVKKVWETNSNYRATLQKKAVASVHKDLEAYKQYKADGGELSWKPFRTMLAKQRKSK